MAKTANTFGGGAQTNINGLCFEQETSLNDALLQAGYSVNQFDVYDGEHLIGKSLNKQRIYKYFLEPNGIDYTKYNSKRWEPDECFINLQNQCVYIIEKKFQNSAGSVDEKLPSCHFKRGEYLKLFSPLGFSVVFLYVFNDWFKQEQYRDTLEYIEYMGCHYFFDKIPLGFLGL